MWTFTLHHFTSFFIYSNTKRCSEHLSLSTKVPSSPAFSITSVNQTPCFSTSVLSRNITRMCEEDLWVHMYINSISIRRWSIRPRCALSDTAAAPLLPSSTPSSRSTTLPRRLRAGLVWLDKRSCRIEAGGTIAPVTRAALSPLAHSLPEMLCAFTHLHNRLLTPLLYSSITALLSQSTFCLSMSLLHQDLHKRLISQFFCPPCFPLSIILCFFKTLPSHSFISKIQSSWNDSS